MKIFCKTGQNATLRRQPIIDFQNETVEMYVASKVVEEDVERGRGTQFFRWDLGRRLGENQTPSLVAKFLVPLK